MVHEAMCVYANGNANARVRVKGGREGTDKGRTMGDRIRVGQRRQKGDQAELTRRMERNCGGRRERMMGASVRSERGGRGMEGVRTKDGRECICE
jgi:hypothetical protein